MDKTRWQRMMEALDRALEAESEQRAARLDELLADDPELLAEAQRILASHDDTGEFLPMLGEEPSDRVGPRERIGAYRLLGELDHGGMGVVYLAQRDDDEFSKRVAIKVALQGDYSTAAADRLRQERQILASLDHENIARLLDGGTTEDGRPYFVMEYVEGELIDKYCENARLSVSERLELFLKVCGAVQFAHQNLVIHRDLKPANILVNAQAQPKLLDFGIAKLLNPDLLGGSAVETVGDVRALTPEYASPEQIQGRPMTTASDVYSLGVLLHRLLSGGSPYSGDARNLPQLARQVCEDEPRSPSEVAGAPGATPSSGDRSPRQLQGDLDNIVLLALRKERSRRYGSVEQLAEDVRRYLDGRPVSARSPTLFYRTSKFARRHPLGITAGLAVALTSAAFVVQSFRVRAERDRAESEAAKAGAVNQFLGDMLGSADPRIGEGRDVRLLDVLSSAESRIGDSFATQPEVEGALRATIGRTYLELSLYELAEPQLERALDIRQDLADARLERAESLLLLGRLRMAQGEYAEAEGLLSEALDVQARELGLEHPARARVLKELATASWYQGSIDDAEKMLTQALHLVEGHEGGRPEDEAEIVNDLAVMAWSQSDLETAESRLRRAHRVHEAVLPPAHPARIQTVANLATVLSQQERFDEAEPLLREALATQSRELGERHSAVAQSMANLAALLAQSGRLEEAEDLHRRALDIRRDTLPTGHRAIGESLVNLGDVSTQRGDHRTAEGHYRKAVQNLAGSAGPDHWWYPLAQSRLGECLMEQGRYAEARAELSASLEGYRTIMGEDDPGTHKVEGLLQTLQERSASSARP